MKSLSESLEPRVIQSSENQMRPFKILASCMVLAWLGPVVAYSQTAVLYEGARLIIGDASAPIENGAFLVQNGQITAIGARGAVSAPAGVTHVDLTGKTVMPALVNIHVHLAWELFTPYGDVPAGPDNFTLDNLVDHLEREAFYGVGTVNDGGSGVISVEQQFQAEQAAKKLPPAAQLSIMAGVVAPDVVQRGLDLGRQASTR